MHELFSTNATDAAHQLNVGTKRTKPRRSAGMFARASAALAGARNRLNSRALHFVTTVTRSFVAYEADEADTKRFRVRQLEAVLRLTPMAMGINLMNVAVVDRAVWKHGHHGILLLWSATIAAMAVMG